MNLLVWHGGLQRENTFNAAVYYIRELMDTDRCRGTQRLQDQRDCYRARLGDQTVNQIMTYQSLEDSQVDNVTYQAFHYHLWDHKVLQEQLTLRSRLEYLVGYQFDRLASLIGAPAVLGGAAYCLRSARFAKDLKKRPSKTVH